MVLALAGCDEHNNTATAAGPEAITAQLKLPGGSASGSSETVPLEVRARPHGGFEVATTLTAACDFEVCTAFDVCTPRLHVQHSACCWPVSLAAVVACCNLAALSLV